MDDFIEKLAAALNIAADSITADALLADLPNWDSLAILTTLGMLDEEYGVSMSGTDLQGCRSVSDLYAKVQALLA